LATQSLAPGTVSSRFALSTFLRIALFMAGTVAVGTLAGTFSGEKLNFLYKDQLHLAASGAATLAVFLSVPDYLRPIIGAGSDFFPLFGYHRRSYYALAALFGALGFFCLSLLPHYSYLTTALLVIVTIAGGVTAMIMADAIMVTVGNREGVVGRIQAVQQLTPYLLLLLFAARLGGYVTQHWSYAHCFRAAALTTLFALPLTFLIDEKRVIRQKQAQETPEEHAVRLEAKRAERTLTLTALKRAVRSPGLWAVVAFVFYLIFTPGTNTAQFYYSVDTLHFSKQFLGSLGQFSSAGTILGILAFAAISRKLPVFALSWGAWALDCSLYLISFGLHDALSAKIVTFALAFFGIIYTLCLFTLAARACPKYIEGTIYGLVMSAYALAGALGEKVGSTVYDFYGPAHGHSTAHGWFALNGWGLALTVPAALLIFLLPAWTKSREPLSAQAETIA
jgi:MFS family permease